MPICNLCDDSGFVPIEGSEVREVLAPFIRHRDGTVTEIDRPPQTIVVGFLRCTCRTNDDMKTYPPPGHLDDFGPSRKKK